MSDEIEVLESRTVTQYVYDSLGRVLQETKLYYKYQSLENVFALNSVYVEHGGEVPDGYVIADKSHIYAKGTVYVKLPEKEVIEDE